VRDTRWDVEAVARLEHGFGSVRSYDPEAPGRDVQKLVARVHFVD
jgi:hypothetical protein